MVPAAQEPVGGSTRSGRCRHALLSIHAASDVEGRCCPSWRAGERAREDGLLAPERFFDFRWPERDTDRLEWSNWGMMSSCGSVAWVWLADIMFGLGNCTFGANTKTEPSGMLDCLAADMMRASSEATTPRINSSIEYLV